MKMLTKRKLGIRLSIATVVLICAMLACSLMGTEQISLKSVMSSVADGQVNPDYEIFVRVRIPRILLAVIVGAALACSGVVFQALLRNPLADPYILGISSGAGLGVIVAMLLGLATPILGRSPVAVFAFVGAIGTVLLVWFIGRITGRKHVAGLLLAGVVVNAFFSALIMFLTSVGSSDQVFSTIFWLMGNITEETAGVLWSSGGIVAAGIVGLFMLAPKLNAISFGQIDAKTMGVNTGHVQLAAFSIAALITAVAVSLSGLVGFVGLIIPHAVRLVCGPDHRQLIPLSAILAATFMVAADTVARIIVAPAQLPVGVVTALIGGPFFLFLLVRYSRKVGWQK